MGNPILKILIWTFLNSTFGLVSFFILTTGDWLKFGEFTPHDVINDGVLMFFWTSIMGAVSVDYLLEKRQYNRFISYGIYIFPFVVLASVVFIYTVLHYKASATYSYPRLSVVQAVITFMALFYSVGVKFAIFSKQ